MIWLNIVSENVYIGQPSVALAARNLKGAASSVRIRIATNLQRTVQNMWRMRYERDSFPREED